MEVYLVNDQVARFTPRDNTGPVNWIASVYAQPVPVNWQDGGRLLEDPAIRRLLIDGGYMFPRRNAILVNVNLQNEGSVTVVNNNVLSKLENTFGGHFTLKISFKCGRLADHEYESGERELSRTADFDYQAEGLGIPRGLVRDWVSRLLLRVHGRVSIKLIVSATGLAQMVKNGQPRTQGLGARLLRHGEMDFLIKTAGGHDVPCHKMVLAASSPVFKGMFSHNLIETRTGTVQLLEISKEGAEALISFMYKDDIADVVKDSAIAVQLLEVGHMYDVIGAVAIVSRVIMLQPYSWFSDDAARRLFEFTTLVPEMEDLMKKAMNAIHWRVSHRLSSALSEN